MLMPDRRPVTQRPPWGRPATVLKRKAPRIIATDDFSPYAPSTVLKDDVDFAFGPDNPMTAAQYEEFRRIALQPHYTHQANGKPYNPGISVPSILTIRNNNGNPVGIDPARWDIEYLLNGNVRLIDRHDLTLVIEIPGNQIISGPAITLPRPAITIQGSPMTSTLPALDGSRVMGDRPLSDVTKRFFDELEREVYGTIGDAIVKHDQEIEEKLKRLDETLKTNCYTLEIRSDTGVGKIEGIRHKQLDQLIAVSTQRIPVMLVGMAGTGKSHACEQVAEGLGLPFYAMSVGAQTSKSDIIGFVHAGGEYVPTLFRQAYEHGGVFLMDEIDAGNANVLILINAALANGYCAFPGGMVKQHQDFVFVASANTFGNGANRQYVGRNQLDAATLDRFALIEWEIDDNLEASLAGDSRDGKHWYNGVKRVRAEVTSEGMRVLVTPRATQRGAKLIAAGMPMEQAAAIALFNLFPHDKREWAKKAAKLNLTGARKAKDAETAERPF